MSDDVPSKSMKYIRLRSPSHHGDTLQIPPLNSVSELWQSSFATVGASTVQRDAQAELASIALAYSRTYLNRDDVDLSQPVIISGHQPALFHCGVWYKNFALSKLGQQLRATAINLVVDNDLCTGDSILCPQVEKNNNGKIETARMQRLPIDERSAAVAYESRLIQSHEQFDSFGERASRSIEPIVSNPLARKLWPHVLQVKSGGELRLGHALAAGRHRLEQSFGLKTLELPISKLADSLAFRHFTQNLLERRADLQLIYNDSLRVYRKLHGIRSTAHPVPELETDQEWTETPFWVWTDSSASRKRLFATSHGSTLRLTDRDGWSAELNQNAYADWAQSKLGQVFIRPRALTTTMFCRAFCGSLFLHGIGGAKYDQLNDTIMQKFCGVEPPAYLTLSATLRLPAQFDEVTTHDETKIKTALRNLDFHPEKHFDPGANVDAQQLVAEKQKLVQDANTFNNRKQRNDAIVAINRQLQPNVEAIRKKLLDQQDFVSQQLRTSQVLSSREYSFALFPESIVEELNTAAKDNAAN